MKRLSLAYILLLFLCTAGLAQSKTDSLVRVLKKEISEQETYVEQRRERIDRLNERVAEVGAADLERQFALYNELYHEYKTFVNDSAFRYAGRLIHVSRQLKDTARIGYAHLKLGFTLLSAGMFKETFDTLRVVNVSALPDSSLVDYYKLYARAYADLMIFNNHEHFLDVYRQHYRAYLDSALNHCTPGSYQHYYVGIIKNLHLQRYEQVIRSSEELIRHQTLTNPQAAVYHYDLADAWRNLGNQEKVIENLLLSAIADLRGATKENAAMYSLARELHKKGDSPNAYIFIQQALHDAQFYGARQRQVEINSILPMIASDQLNTLNERRQRWVIYSAGATLIVILVTVFSIIIYKQLKRLKAAEREIKQANQNLQAINRKLVEVHKIKEEYIGYYFNMTTDYVNRIDVLRKQVMNLLLTERKKEALSLLGKYNPMEERTRFVKDFDHVFLRLFPDFVHQFNQLIDPEDATNPEHPDELTADMRIFALIRLGIHDNRKIGEILNYSVNTVYAYKTRVRNKAVVPADEFLKRLMDIKSVDGELHTLSDAHIS